MKKNEIYEVFDAIFGDFTNNINTALDEMVSVVLAEDSLPTLKAENLALRQKLNHFKREYGRASATIGQLRAELAKVREEYRQLRWPGRYWGEDESSTRR